MFGGGQGTGGGGFGGAQSSQAIVVQQGNTQLALVPYGSNTSEERHDPHFIWTPDEKQIPMIFLSKVVALYFQSPFFFFC